MGQDISINVDLSDINHVIEQRQLMQSPEYVIELLNKIYRKMQEDERKTVLEFNQSKNSLNWLNLITIMRGSNIQINQTVIKLLNPLLKYNESYIALDSYSKGTLMKQLIQTLTTLSLNNNTIIQFEATRAINEISKIPRYLMLLMHANCLSSLIALIQDPTLKINSEMTHKSFEVQKNALQCLVNFSDYQDEEIKLQLKQRGILPLISIIAQCEIDEIVQLTMHVLASLAENERCREEIMLNDGLQQALIVFNKTNDEEIKLELARLFNNLCQDLNIQQQIKDTTLVHDLITLAHQASQQTDQTAMYQYISTLLTLSINQKNYKIMRQVNFYHSLQNLSFNHIQNESKLHIILQGYEKFCRRATELSVAEVFLLLVKPMAEFIITNQSALYNNNSSMQLASTLLAIQALSSLSLRCDCMRLLSHKKVIYPLLKILMKVLAMSKSEVNKDAVLYLAKAITNLLINTQNLWLATDQDYSDALSELRFWSSDQSSWQAEEIYIEVQLTIYMKPAEFLLYDEKQKLQYAKDNLKSPNKHIQIKVAALFAHMANDLNSRKLLLQNKIFDILVFLLKSAENCIVREAAAALVNILKSPEGLCVWLKFDSSRLSLDASGCNIFVQRGNPIALREKDRGIFTNWGVAVINKGDSFEAVKDGIVMNEQYTISFRMVLPLPPQQNLKQPSIRMLLQGNDGGGIVGIDKNKQFIGVWDQNSGKFIQGIPIDMLKAGWNHIVIKIDNIMKEAIFYMNGSQFQLPRPCFNMRNVKTILNGSLGDYPFGIVADLRIYSLLLDDITINNLHLQPLDTEPIDNPDKQCLKFMDGGGISTLIDALQRCKFYESQMEVCHALAILATNQDCKIEILRQNGFDILLDYINDFNTSLRMAASKVLVSLN